MFVVIGYFLWEFEFVEIFYWSKDEVKKIVDYKKIKCFLVCKIIEDILLVLIVGFLCIYLKYFVLKLV